MLRLRNVLSQVGLSEVSGLVERAVHMYLETHRNELLSTAVSIDRQYLVPLNIPSISDNVSGEAATAMIDAIANAFINEGLRQTA